MRDNGLRCAVRTCNAPAEMTGPVPGGEVALCLAHDAAYDRATVDGNAGAWLSRNIGGTFAVIKATGQVAASLLAGHADAEHWGVIDADCERCVTLAEGVGVALRVQSLNDSTNGGE